MSYVSFGMWQILQSADSTNRNLTFYYQEKLLRIKRNGSSIKPHDGIPWFGLLPTEDFYFFFIILQIFSIWKWEIFPINKCSSLSHSSWNNWKLSIWLVLRLICSEIKLCFDLNRIWYVPKATCKRTPKSQQCWKSVLTYAIFLRYAPAITEQKTCWQSLKKCLTDFKLLQLLPTTGCAEETQHVASVVGSCWPTMLHPFARGFIKSSTARVRAFLKQHIFCPYPGVDVPLNHSWEHFQKEAVSVSTITGFV